MFERTTPKISIVIPSWFKSGMDGMYGKDETFNIAYKCMKRMLDTLDISKMATFDDWYELIIVNNGSDLEWEAEDYDIRAKVLLYWGYADVIVRNPKNLGFAPAMNQGFNLARGEYIFGMNNDIFLWPGWEEELIRPFELSEEELKQHPEIDKPVGIVMPNIIKKNYQKDCLREDGSGKLDMMKVFELKKEDIELPRRETFEPGAEFGSLWCARRTFLDRIRNLNEDGQVYDENFKVGFGEDRKLWAQVRQLGCETYRTNYARVAHVGNMTISKIPDRKKYTEANREYLADWKKKEGIK